MSNGPLHQRHNAVSTCWMACMTRIVQKAKQGRSGQEATRLPVAILPPQQCKTQQVQLGMRLHTSLSHRWLVRLKGNSHQILLSEMSLPGIEVHIEKLLPKILGRLGRRTSLKDEAKLPLYSASVL